MFERRRQLGLHASPKHRFGRPPHQSFQLAPYGEAFDGFRRNQSFSTEWAESGQSLRTVLSSPGGKVTVLHVKEKVPNHAISNIPANYETNLKAAIRDRLEGLAAQFEDGAGVLIEGHSGKTILQWAEANQVDCIVIMSHRPGLQDYFLGSTAGRIVRHAQCSVHVIC